MQNGHGNPTVHKYLLSHCKHIEFIIIKYWIQNNIGYSRALVEGLLK